MAKRRRAAQGAQTIGGMLAGFDGQVFRTTPPPHELVRKGDRLPTIPTGDSGVLILELPEDPVEPAERHPEPTP